MYFLELDGLSFFGPVLLEGARGATFNSNLFLHFYKSTFLDDDQSAEYYDGQYIFFY